MLTATCRLRIQPAGRCYGGRGAMHAIIDEQREFSSALPEIPAGGGS